MPRLANKPAEMPSAGSVPIVQETVTTKTTTQSAPLILTPPNSPPEREPKDDVNTWFLKLDPDYRTHHVAYYLYRNDPNIQVVTTNLEGRANGSMLYRFTPELINKFAEGPFMEELQLWTKEEYGGGSFHVKINDTKLGRMLYSIPFKNEGPARLSTREAYASGAPQTSSVGDQSTVRMLIEFIDKKLDAVKAGGQDPAAAVGQVTQVLMDSQSKMFAWMLDHQPKTGDSVQQLEQMRNMLAIVKELIPQPTALAENPKSFTEQLQEFMALQDLMEKMRGKNAVPEGQSLAAQIAEAIAKAGITRAKGTDWTWVIDGMKVLAPALAPIGVALAEKIRATGSAPGAPATALTINGRPVTGAPQGGRPTSGPVGSAPMPGMPAGPPGMGSAAPSAPAPAVTANPATAPASSSQVITPDMMDAMAWHTIKTRLVDMLRNNDEGSAAAASISFMFPKQAGNFAMATPPILMGVITGDETLRELKDDPRLPAFLDSFCEWFKGEKEDADELEEPQEKIN